MVRVDITNLGTNKQLLGDQHDKVGLTEPLTQRPGWNSTYRRTKSGEFVFKVALTGEVEYWSTITAPEWVEYDAAAEADEVVWDTFIAHVMFHEEGHDRIEELMARYFEIKLNEQLQGLRVVVAAKNADAAKLQSREQIKGIVDTVEADWKSKVHSIEAKYHEVVGEKVENSCQDSWNLKENQVFSEIVGMTPAEIMQKDQEIEHRDAITKNAASSAPKPVSGKRKKP
jgi:hypothetical protein